MVRGGAPFLSGADATLLAGWLDEELPVAGILACIDAVAARRRRSPTRSRLTLSACKAEVKKLRSRLALVGATGDPAPSTATPAPRDGAGAGEVESGWQRLLAEIQGLSLPPPLGPQLQADLRALAAAGLPPLDGAAGALDAVRRGMVTLWDTSDQDALRDRATAELGPILAVVPPRRRAELIEQGARDQLLRQWPALTAPHICRVLGALS